MWGILLERLAAKSEGLHSYELDITGAKQKGNSLLHLLDKAEREAQHSYISAAFGEGIAVKRARYARYYPQAQLAHVGLSGPIFRRADTMDTSDAQSTESLMATVRTLSTGQVSTVELKRDAEGYAIGTEEKHDNPVKQVLFTMDGPGGEATQIDEAAQLIHGMPAKGITTVGFVEGLCASAHYYMGSAMQHLFAGRMSMTGSIGVVMGVGIPAAKDAEGRNIIETPSGKKYVEFVDSDAEFKRADPTSEAGMEYYQKLVNDSAQVFRADAAAYRNIPQADAKERLGQGRILGAKDALSLGLVDDIGTFDEVFDALTKGELTAQGQSMVGAGAAA
jgi:hypothetical protein